MGEFDGLKIKAEDNPFAGLKVSPGGSRYQEPKSFSKTDDELGLSNDLSQPGDEFGNKARLSPVEQQLKSKYGADIDFLKEIAPYAAGGVIGKTIGGALGSTAVKQGASRIGQATEVMSTAIQNTAANHLNSAALKALGILVGPEFAAAAKSVPIAARSAAAGVGAAAPMATAAAASGAVSGASTNPKPYRGVWSNAVKQLRASAAGNPRAQELLSRIDAIPDSGAGTGEVTQGTLGQ